MRIALLAAALLVATGGAHAEAPGTAPRPEPRAETEAPQAPSRPPPTAPRPQPQAGSTAAGSVCGDPAILGQTLRPIPGEIDGCGIAAPVEITHAAGLRLSQPATIDCPTAISLRKWAEETVKPAVGRRGGGVVGLRVAAHYICRTRNHQPGAKVSEHGRGRAIDISAFELANGNEITVLKGWKPWRQGRMLRRIHKGACGPFGTVLGPKADRFHRDHFHLDTARYRSGSYCR